jgi:hypothetical protein
VIAFWFEQFLLGGAMFVFSDIEGPADKWAVFLAWETLATEGLMPLRAAGEV